MSSVLNRQRASGSGAQGGAGYVIENSLRFNDDDSAYLSFTKGAPTDGSKGVMGVWLKRSNISLSAISTIVYGSPGESTRIEITNGTDVINIADDGVQCLETNQVFRDPTAFFHLLLSYDSDEGTAANRLKMFLNGVEITSFAADGRSNIASGEEWGLLVNGGVQQWGFGAGAGTYWDGYMAQAFIIDGTSIQNGDYAVSDFIDTDSNGNVIPVDLEGAGITWGNNGSLLDFAIAPGTGDGAGTDVSGNDNHFTDSGLAANDRVSDSPTDDSSTGASNYATLSKIVKPSADNGVISNGGTTSVTNYAVSPFGMTSGKWYVEFTPTSITTFFAALFKDSTSLAFQFTADGEGRAYDNLGRYWKDGAVISTGHGAVSNGDHVAIAVDLDNLNIEWYINNVSKYEATDLEAGQTWYFTCGTSSTVNANFGTAPVTGGETDENGFGDFEFAPPSGYLALCTANLPAPAVKDGTDGFVGVSGLGSGIVSSLASAISTAGWGSDGYISAYRDHATGNSWQVQFESIDGDALNSVHFNTTAATGAIDAFNSSGTYSAMAWRIGTAYGCYAAKVTHTNGVATDTAHGLGSGAKVGIIKAEDVAGSWWMVHPGNTSGNTIAIDQTVAQTATQHVDVDATNITIAAAEASGDYYVIVFEEKSGLLSIGTHEGNANANGPFIYTDGTPALHWSLNIDSGASNRMSHLYADDSTNAHELAGLLDTNGAYVTTSDIDMLGGGVKIRHASGNQGNNAVTHITLTWLSMPFGGLNVSQARAM